MSIYMSDKSLKILKHTQIFMKNFFRLFTAALALLAFVGCEKGAEETSEPRLATPSFKYSVEENSIVIAWEPIANAAYYTVQLDEAEAVKTELNVHTFDNLIYGETYKVTVVAVSVDETLYLNSKPATRDITIPERVIKQYEEWFSVPANAISNNGRYIVGGYDRNGMVIDRDSGSMTPYTTHEFYDISDNGIAVGAYVAVNADGEAACYNINTGENIVPDLSDMFPAASMSCFTGITPDGSYAVGWVWDSSDSYYTRLYGELVPITYDLNRSFLNVPVIKDDLFYGQRLAGISLSGVTPERELFGYEVSLTYFSIMWESEDTPYDYLYFTYDEQANPIDALGDKNNLMSQSGRYIFGKGFTMVGGGQTYYPAAYDRETDTLYSMVGEGYVSAMTDDGIAFLNDVPYYLGTTSYVVDVNEDIMVQTPIVEWLIFEHDIDLTEHILDGIIIIGTSEDGRTIAGITNTEDGWRTFAISLDGAPMK